MKKMTSLEIKKMWINFFVQKGHYKGNSFSLVPEEDPTLLWINAGVTPLKKYFNGSVPVVNSKIVNIQKCLRINDIENVGKTSSHHTFFEMLGNFSIGDYFKEKAIDLAYELLFSADFFAFELQKIYITYYYKDKETYNLWLQKGICPTHLIPLKSNFWNIGSGPCGPCTEIFFDRGSKYHAQGPELIYKDIDNERFVEIWNIVFSQYNFIPDDNKGRYEDLINKNIDTGAGLERLACVIQDVETNFETDIFASILSKISFLSSISYKGQISFRVIADHIRALVFAIGDGVSFANDGRGYVLKKILRQAVKKGQELNFKDPFLYKLVDSVIHGMDLFYPELGKYKEILKKTIYKEELKFFQMIKNVDKKISLFIKNNFLSGDDYFKLYDTYGIPKEIILEYIQKNSLLVDTLGFQKKLELQQKISRSNQNFKNTLSISDKSVFVDFKDKSEFIGYDIYELKTKVIKVFKEGIVLAKTPFYPIMGGQISDSGWIDNISVEKSIRLHNGQILHFINHFFEEGQEVIAKINITKRYLISLHHTATHLLHDATCNIFGNHVEQKGSFIGESFLRWDFNHYEKINDYHIIQIENLINEWINQKIPVVIQDMKFSDVLKNSNIHYLKNKKYPEVVRSVKIGDISLALCAGTHVSNTQELKKIVILSYESVGSGIYRIEAFVGNKSLHKLNDKIKYYLSEKDNIINKANKMNSNNECELLIPQEPSIVFSFQDVVHYKSYLNILKKNYNDFRKKLLSYQKKYVLSNIDQFIPKKITSNMILVIDNIQIEKEVLKYLLEYLFKKMNVKTLLICYSQDHKLFFVCKSINLDANSIIKDVSQIAGGSGGGKKNFAQGSGKFIDKIDEILMYWKKNLL